jgi:hypothetical protein
VNDDAEYHEDGSAHEALNSVRLVPAAIPPNA